jgi:ABC-type branched-subunit amino acid transport system ATPase component/ABC-type branched-subunit amino acid transport system permease subunit
MTVLSWQITEQTLITGALTGLTYAVLAAGLVLVYRATRVINFAYAEIGAIGAVALARLVLDLHWSFWLALPVVLLIGAALGGAIELVVVRRLFRAPRLMLLVATVGLAQLLFVAGIPLGRLHHPGPFPTPLPWHVQVGSLRLGSADFMVMVVAPAVVIGLGWFLNRTRYGLAIRVAADNPERAELAGISTKNVSTLVWVMSGVLATLTVILLDPRRGVVIGVPAPSLGPSLLLRALAAALIGRLVSLPWTLAGGVAIGVGEAVIFANVRDPGVVDVVLLVVVITLVMVRGRGLSDHGPALSLTPRVEVIPESLRRVWWVRHLGAIAGGVALLVAGLLPVVISTPSRNYQFTSIVIFALIGLSVTVLTGWAGQLSLGQFAFVGLGAVVAAAFVQRGASFPVAVVYATAACVLAAMIIGFPALRVRGLMLAVTTLALAIAAQSWILRQPVFVGKDSSDTITVPRTRIFGVLDLHSQRTYYACCLGLLALALLAVGRLRSSGIGRAMIGVRDNEAAAASFGISPTLAKLTAFGLAGGLAGLAGALLAGLQVSTAVFPHAGAGGFGAEQSLQIVAMTVIGGLGTLSGAVLGAVYVVGLPAFFSGNATIGLLSSGIGLLVLLLYFPGGLAQLVFRVRDQLVRAAERRVGAPSTARIAPAARALAARAPDVALDPEVDVLSVADIRVKFGGRAALDGISLNAGAGEIVGLIGSNGAGKSTLMNVIGGNLTAAAGWVHVFGQDVTAWPPHERARLGVGRVFQDARLFAHLTVRETVMLALEAEERSEFVPSLLSLPPSVRAERHKRAAVVDYIDFLGLGRYADAYLSDLSTGTRRIAEMTCLLAQGSRLLLLDEPTAGVAQRETEAFGPLIRRLQGELGATVLIIEHDMPLVMSISDRVYCLSAGACIAEGPPEVVRNDPRVVAAYLGTDERAIERSGTGVSA